MIIVSATGPIWINPNIGTIPIKIIIAKNIEIILIS